ncbi:four helix bundle protein [Paenibacillus vini]|uniref:Four helix bundle protein n=1 Tax=Paenibacillus vini TaxID=1476024 RepID=A0ABQ4MAC8_9BACL|nr:four helix bundle protein [Paenibacillus vini]GIP52953.1 hypothetical protein J42TS3_19880 [Paenibacillus vini]
MKKIRNIVDRDVRTLSVYQKSLGLVDQVKIIHDALPWREKEVLGDQIWRAATSIAGNISEANAQVYISVSFRQLNSALGSGGETCTWLEILFRCGYIDQNTFDSLFEKVMEIRRMLIGMMKKLLVEMEDEIEVA